MHALVENMRMMRDSLKLLFMTVDVSAQSLARFVSNKIRECQVKTALSFLLVYSRVEQDGGVTFPNFTVHSTRQLFF